MRLVSHIGNVLWVKLWANLAALGIGDPLNQLVYVAPFRVIRPSYHYKPRNMRSYRRNYRTEAKIAKDMAQLAQPSRKEEA